MRFHGAVARYKMMDHKVNEGTREEMGINTTIKRYQKKWLEHLERTPET
jgi:hypothetical protein